MNLNYDSKSCSVVGNESKESTKAESEQGTGEIILQNIWAMFDSADASR